MLTYKIHLIRHGLTQGNLEGRYIGITDTPLCAAGREQLAELYENYEYPWVEKVFTSPMLRAQETAEILFPNREAQIVDDLHELNFGIFEGRTIDDLENDPAFKEWIASPASACPPGGESGTLLAERASNALASIFAQMMRERIASAAVVTHGGLIMSLLAAMGLPEQDMLHWTVPNGGGYTILLTTQMWMRDHKFEVYEKIPYKCGQAGEEETGASLETI